MERKIKDMTIGQTGTGGIVIHAPLMPIVFTKEQSQALHSALEEMLNPWRDAGSYSPNDGEVVHGCTIEGRVLRCEYDSDLDKFFSGETVVYSVVKWKPITLPNTTKD